MLSDWWQDVPLAIRGLRRQPGFAAVVILTLTLGIGATTAVFSVVKAVLLTAPPFDEPERLVLISSADPQMPRGAAPLSYPNYSDLRAATKTLSDLGAWTSFGPLAMTLTGKGRPERLAYALGSASLFRTLRVSAVVGRTFSDEEDQFGGAPAAVLLSYPVWRRQFGGDSTVVGRTILLDARPYTVVGVLPRAFDFVTFPRAPDIWIPLGQDPVNPGRHYGRGVSYLGAIGRMRPGATMASAAADVEAVRRHLAEANPGFLGFDWRLTPLGESSSRPLRTPLYTLLGAVTLVLLIACVNVATLLLARMSERGREVAVRLALGAGRVHLLRWTLVESATLAALGGAGGVACAVWGVALISSLPVFGPPSWARPYAVTAASLHVDGGVLLFALALSLLTGVVFGVMPALQGARIDIREAVSARRAGARRQTRTRELLVVAEVALALVLLASAGLLVKSLLRLTSVEVGFRPRNVLAADLSLPTAKYPGPDRWRLFYAAVIRGVEGLPGVEAAGVVDQAPLAGPVQSTGFRILGEAPPDPSEPRGLPYAVASPGFFRALGVTLVAGRLPDERDEGGAARVVVVNEAAARRYLGGTNPLGRRLTLSSEALHVDSLGRATFDWDGASREIIGVIGDMRYIALGSVAEPLAIIPFAQAPWRATTLVVRGALPPADVARGVAAVLAGVDPDVPLARPRAMEDAVATSIGEPRFRTLALALFAAVAVVLAAVGIYGVLAYAVSRRTAELGVRAALGATRAELATLVLGDAARITAIGTALGLLGALAATQVLRGLLYEISPLDLRTFTAATLGLLGVAALAAWLPARRAARIDPMEALRHE